MIYHKSPISIQLHDSHIVTIVHVCRLQLTAAERLLADVVQLVATSKREAADVHGRLHQAAPEMKRMEALLEVLTCCCA